jgi:hypothetical protein
MKKIFSLLALLALTLSAMAQEIVYDRTNANGVRTVICSGTNTGVSEQMDVHVALAGFYYKGSVTYSLAVTIGSSHDVQIPQGGKLILTLNNGKTVELTTVSGGMSKLDAVDIDFDAVYESHSRFTYYNIKKKYLKKIDLGIAGIDIQLMPQSYAMAFNQDTLGILFANSYAVINQAFGKK